MKVKALVDRFYAELSELDANDALLEVMDWDERNCAWYAYDLRRCLVRVLRTHVEDEEAKEGESA